jgi:thiol:disulfide interchange protein
LVIGAGVWLLARGINERRGGALIGGTLVATMGVFWLLDNLGRVNERVFAPVLLIALGAGLLLRTLLRMDRVS